MNKRQAKKKISNVGFGDMRKKRVSATFVSTVFLDSDNKECAYNKPSSRMVKLKKPKLKVKS